MANTGHRFLGHSANGDGAGVPELLCDHVRRVAELAERFAMAFGANEQAGAAALLHDLGKYADQFQRRLQDAHERGRDHWTTGAYALAKCGKYGFLPAIASEAHHRGLTSIPPRATDFERRLYDRITDPALSQQFTTTDCKMLAERFHADGFQWPKIACGLIRGGQWAASDMLDARMLFSALVDADFLATEGHFNGDAISPYVPRDEGPALNMDQALAALSQFVAEVRKRHGKDPISPLREQLYSAAMAAAEKPLGAFTLTAPTGCGKTLAMLAFALHHAKRHGLRRIILVMPFLNIIDQAAKIYGAIFGKQNGFPRNTVLEHHSLAGRRGSSTEGDDNGRNSPARLLSENWDAPIVLTTTVQFFESLMACRTSPCRKLHRIAGSVVLFDEAQSLPLKLAAASLATVSRLADSAGPYKTSIVLATATQPAFDLFDGRIRKRDLSPGWKPAEIVAENAALFQGVSSRVAVIWRHETPIELDDLALEIAQLPRVLCIVNLKRHAVRLATKLGELGVKGLLHLSTNLCPAHREEVLQKIDVRLMNDGPICLIATQCVEAGVDLDFPVVYRALAPLEAIAQAAGRCNRHGLGEPGQLIVFKPLDIGRLYPPGYDAAVQATESFLKSISQTNDINAIDIINSPALLRRYYDHHYVLTGRSSEEHADEEELLNAMRAGDFAEVARLFRLIDNNTINVLVPYQREAFHALRKEPFAENPLSPKELRDWMRRAAPQSVAIIRPSVDNPMTPHLQPVPTSSREIELSAAEWAVALPQIKYDRLLGIMTPTDNFLEA